MRRHLISTVSALIVAAALAGPAAAGGDRSFRFSFEESYAVDHACGIVEYTTVTGRGTAFFDGSGTWLRDRILFTFDGTYVGPSGASLDNRTVQVVDITPANLTLRGQGVFIRGGSTGVLVYDVGRLVIDGQTGAAIFATPKVIPFNDPDGLAAIDAALCDVLG